MKVAVIGLGRFGYRCAVTLAENGMEVLGVDTNEATINTIRDQITHSVCLRVTDEEALRSIGAESMDTVIVAMGENFAQSILVTALLKKRLHTKQVITRAISDIHKEILRLVGADQVIMPEEEVGMRIADSLTLPGIPLIRINRTFVTAQLLALPKFIGKRLSDIPFFSSYSVSCCGVKRGSEIRLADPEYQVQSDDVLVITGDIKHIASLARKL
jgi:trk system potassium uptake protein TrkA